MVKATDIKSVTQTRKSFEIPLQEIKEACCQAFGSKVEDFDNPNISNSICNARQAYWLIVKRTRVCTLQDIATPFSRSRNNIKAGIAKCEHRLKNNTMFLEQFLSIGQHLNATAIIAEIVKTSRDGE